jgi:UDP-glucose 4-epimerase
MISLDNEQTRFDNSNAIRQITADLTNRPSLPEADIIVHLAAHSQVQPVVNNSQRAVENFQMTQHVLDEARRMDATVILASSRDVYDSQINAQEEDATYDSPNPYAASKQATEAIGNAFKNTFDLSVVHLRFSNVYGPFEQNSRVIPLWISLGHAGNPLKVYGQSKLLDFVFVEDVIEAIESVMQRREMVSGETINIASGKGMPLHFVAKKIYEQIDACPEYTTVENRSGDVSRFTADISKASSLLNWGPSTEFDIGLRETINWFGDHTDVMAEILSEYD